MLEGDIPAKINYKSTARTHHSRYYSDLTSFMSAEPDNTSFFEEIRCTQSRCPREKQSNSNRKEQSNKQQLLDKLAKINENSSQTKQDKIRVKQWLTKLSIPQDNPVWHKNSIFYLKVLQQMLQTSRLSAPFNALPAQGPLPKLTVYDLDYPLREKFSQRKNTSQERSLSKRSTGTNPNKSDVIVRLGELKGHQFQVGTHKINKEKKVVLGNGAKKSIAVVQRTSTFEFESQQCDKLFTLSKKMSVNPVSSQSKARKEAIKNSNSTRMKNAKNPSLKPSQVEQNNQNDPGIINISRKLFKSRQKTSETFSTQYFNKTESESDPQNQVPSQLQDSMFGDHSKILKRVSQNIKSKFQQTQNETMQFMRYLSRLKSQKIHKEDVFV